MVYVNWSFLANIQHALLPDRNAIVEEAYIPLLDLLETFRELPCDLFFSGVTSEYLGEYYPEVVERVRRGLATGRYRLGSCGYSMAKSSSLSMESTERQVTIGREIDVEIWKTEPNGFWPPMYCVDPSLVNAVTAASFDWMFLAHRNIEWATNNGPAYPAADEIDPYLPFSVKGLSGASITGVPCFSTNNFKILKDGSESPVDRLKSALAKTTKQQRKASPLLVLDQDAEFCYASEFVGDGPRTIERAKRLIETLLEMENVKLTFVDDYLSRCDVRQDIFVPPEATGIPQAAEKYYKLSERAELVLLEAERKISGLGKKNAAFDVRLKDAWKLLLKSQNTDAKYLHGDCDIAWKPYPQLILECMEAAIKAQSIGESILKDLSQEKAG